MNAEILERLVMDRASGELPPDTVALLEAHLQTVPEAAVIASEIDATLLLAKKALTSTPTPALPAPTFDQPLRVLEREGNAGAGFTRWLYGMAACFIGGIVITWFMMRPSPVAPPIRETTAPQHPIIQARDAEPGFWSVSRLYAANSAAAPNPAHTKLVWTSPVRKPQIEPQP